MNIAIIPARSGSKRIRLKNIKIFSGKPIIYWTIKELKKSRIFDHILTSSDSTKILNIAKKCGSDLLNKRSKNLSKDNISTIKVIKSEIENLQNILNIKNFNVCCVYPCNPLLIKSDLQKAIKKMKKNRSKFIVSVSEAKKMEKTFFLEKNNKIKLSIINLKKINKNSNNMKKLYYENGQFCFANNKIWLKNSSIYNKAIGYEVPAWRSTDIDEINDWKKAQIIFNLLKKNEK
tara:strand:- start:985 stop:1683 length:699 start_codon:yes stop_codon:yes gene_type:complete